MQFQVGKPTIKGEKEKQKPGSRKYLCRGSPVQRFLQSSNKVWEFLSELNVILIFRPRAEEIEDCTPHHPDFRPVHKCKTQSSAGDPRLGQLQSQALGRCSVWGLHCCPQTALQEARRLTVLYDGPPIFLVSVWVLPARPLA